MGLLSRRFWLTDSPAQANIEYAFVIILVAMICLSIVAVAGHQVQNMYQNASNALQFLPAPTPVPTPQ